MDFDDAFAAFDEEAVLEVDIQTRSNEKSFSEEPIVKRSKLADAGLISSIDDSANVDAEVVDTSAFDADLPENFEVVLEKFDNTGDNCLHECIKPAGWVRAPPPDIPPAKQYKFKLDNFQQAAVNCLEQRESVLVSAHTSAGKTVVAEYAISMALRDNQRVIYTSPIKALSNQKFRDLSEEYKDVGLLTGDVSLNPNASVMVMTTEILRSMLYRGSELCREVAWVVFDEIHYMRDRERGVVWEETLVLLPDTVRLVFLSATIPNSAEFAEWICRIKHQPCHLIYTDYRPTPLQHFVFPVGGESVFKVFDEKKVFYEDNFMRALAALQSASDAQLMSGKGAKSAAAKKGKSQSKSDVEKLLTMCKDKGYLPIIVFSFSKKDVEANAISLKKIDLNTPDEKRLVEEIFNKALDTLSDEDRKMPQIQTMLPLLQRGIGMHHGGLLPIVKELIEILFQYSLIKVLFATETFAMGVNMPAKTVIFTGVKKWDGQEFRIVNSGEFIQMSGRAGRRGLDDKGITITMLDDKMEPDAAKNLFIGAANKIDSAFHITYNMLLNLLRVEGADPEYMMRRSFRQHQRFRNAVSLAEKVKALDASLKASEDLRTALAPLSTPGKEDLAVLPTKWNPQTAVASSMLEDEVRRLVGLQSDITVLTEKMRLVIAEPRWLASFLVPGRLVKVVTEDGRDLGWGATVAPSRLNMAAKDEEKGTSRGTIVDVALLLNGPEPTAQEQAKRGSRSPAERDAELQESLKVEITGSKYPFQEGHNHMRIVPVPLHLIHGVSAVKVNLQSQEVIKSQQKLRELGLIMSKVAAKLGESVPLLDPVTDMKIDDESFLQLHSLCAKANKTLLASALHKDLKPQQLEALLAWQTLRAKQMTERTEVDAQLEGSSALVAKDELRAMRRVLLKLNYVDRVNASSSKEDSNNNDAGEAATKELSHTARTVVVSLKGRVACEITTSDELLAAELLFHNFFQDLAPEYCAALLSCLVCDERADDQNPPADPKLLAGYEVVRDVARKIATVAQECKMPGIVIEDYVDKFKPHLMEFVLGWAKGGKFGELAAKTDLFEGSIIRQLRRLEELLRQLAGAARGIGNVELEQRFLSAITMIRRGIIFASSLYL